MFGLSETAYNLIKAQFFLFPEIEQVIIFGSRAMGNYKPGSDIDLALKGIITHDTVIKISLILDEELPLPYLFDVIDYHHIDNPELISHIDQYGKFFYSKATAD